MSVEFFSGRAFLVLFAFATVASERGALALPKRSRSDVSARTGKRQLPSGRGFLRGGPDESLLFLSDGIPFEAMAAVSPDLDGKKRSEEEDDPGEKERSEFSRAFLNFEGGKRRTSNFTPRLGRDSGEEYDENSVDSSYGKSSSRSGNRMGGTFVGSNNFTPRLGRYAIPRRFFDRDRS